jgi:ATP-dependent Lon protease
VDGPVTGLSLELNDVQISAELVHAHERMLTGGFYAEIALTYDAVIAQENNAIPLVRSLQGRSSFPSENLNARSSPLVGDKDPRHHEFTVQLRAFDTAKSGAKLGVAALITLCTALLKKSVRGGLIIIVEINLGGSIEPIHNPVTLAEIAVEKGATILLMPVACRRQLIDLSDDMATKIDIQFYSDARDALLKAMAE